MEKLLLILVLALCGTPFAVQAYAKEPKYRGNSSSRTFATSPAPEDLDPATSDSDQATGADGSTLLRAHPAIGGLGGLGGLGLGPRNGFPLPTNGLGILDKGAPDLQFGLALTIPFVSLATEKLLHSFNPGGNLRSFRSWSDIAQLLKLNVGGLVLAAVVGVAALLFLPSIFHNRGGILKGFGSNLFDNLIQNGIGGGVNKHFGYGQYEHGGYGAGGYDAYSGQQGQGWSNNKYGYKRKDSRDLKDGEGQPSNQNGTLASSSIWNTITTTVARNLPELSECSLYAMCMHGRNSASVDPNSNSTNSESTSAAARQYAQLMGLGELNEYAGRLEEAFAMGRGRGGGETSESTAAEADCAKVYSRCDKIPKFIDRVGKYIFGE